VAGGSIVTLAASAGTGSIAIDATNVYWATGAGAVQKVPPPRTRSPVQPLDTRFEDGVLKSAERLDLRQGERVRLLVLRRSDPKPWDLKRLAAVPTEAVELAMTDLGAEADRIEYPAVQWSRSCLR
jgi:predicted DNA-binding antitoxin AbrB/MazE fold protein